MKLPEVAPQLLFEPDSATVRVAGQWTTSVVDQAERMIASIDWPTGTTVRVDGADITALDTGGACVLKRCLAELEDRDCAVELCNLSDRHRAVLALLGDVLEVAPPGPGRVSFLGRVGQSAMAQLSEAYSLAAFIGEVCLVFLRIALQPTRLRWRSMFAHVETAGFDALPIIGLLSFLVGVVIAYQGGAQLRAYGANIFIVELITLTTVRELAPLLTAILVAGRTGSAFTAQLATMKVSEEVDALRAMGIDPIEILVIPRVLALIVALPLLTVFADAMGILGGMVMASTMLDVSMHEFAQRIPQAISLTSFMIGVGKAPVFAVVLAVVGCFQGLQASGGAETVGSRTTLSVVEGIFLVVVADAAFSVLFSWLGV